MVEGKKGKESGETEHLKSSLGGGRCRGPGWQECVYAAGLLLDMESADFGHPKR